MRLRSDWAMAGMLGSAESKPPSRLRIVSPLDPPRGKRTTSRSSPGSGANGPGAAGRITGSLRFARPRHPAPRPGPRRRRGRRSGRLLAVLSRRGLAAGSDRAKELSHRHHAARREERAPAAPRSAMALAVGRRRRRRARGARRGRTARAARRHRPSLPDARRHQRRAARCSCCATSRASSSRSCRRCSTARWPRPRDAWPTSRGGCTSWRLRTRCSPPTSRSRHDPRRAARPLQKWARWASPAWRVCWTNASTSRAAPAAHQATGPRRDEAPADADPGVACRGPGSPARCRRRGPSMARKPARLEYRRRGARCRRRTLARRPPPARLFRCASRTGRSSISDRAAREEPAEVTGDGARIVLGAGLLQARVVHRPRAHWTVAAGPYTCIEVTGTAFDIGWSAASERARAPPARREPSWFAGRRAARRTPRGRRVNGSSPARTPAKRSSRPSWRHSFTRTLPPRPPPHHARPRSSSPVHLAPRPAVDVVGDVDRRKLSWRPRRRRGTRDRRHLEPWLPCRRRGTGGRRPLHARAWPRRRGTARGARRASPGPPRLAARRSWWAGWRTMALRGTKTFAEYDAYLAESPQGSFVAEALDQKLVALVESSDAVGTRAVAKEYLRRFPHAAHAAYARDHVREP